MAGQHASLAPERWARFSLDQQILMIGNEMNRAGKLLDDAPRRLRAYERVLNLLDLTVATQDRAPLLRELLRWRDLIAALFLSPEGDRERHEAAFRCLLRFTPVSSQQLPHVLGPRPG